MLFFVACGPNDPVNTSPSNIVGAWKIESFIDKSSNQTSHYSSYSFDFAANGIAIAKSQGVNSNGTWQLVNDSGKTKFILNWQSSSLLEEISEDWEVISSDTRSMDLLHVSGGNGATSTIKFVQL